MKDPSQMRHTAYCNCILSNMTKTIADGDAASA